MVADRINQTKDYDIQKTLQIDSFYRESGSSVLQEIMMEWTVMATNMEALGQSYDVDKVRNLIQKTIGYSSERTVKLTAEYFQYLYNSTEVDVKAIAYLSMIVASLKFDFTGQTVDPIEIIKVTLKDFDDNVEKLMRYKDEINKKIR
ncbi:hypothetical protein IV71_GL000587 [Fructobacillus fructosus KCTC 3544]|nr:hypothetical protein IV71_GL000587 [Fructobacillus fructosus KCTC 3544]